MSPGKALILAGLVLIVLGVFFTYGGKIPFLGKLPGDIRIEKDNFSFYFPVTTCILLSVLISLIFWLFRR
ncbi:MAG: DUF2905 domain-containing protein [Desulfuromonadales bacterium]